MNCELHIWMVALCYFIERPFLVLGAPYPVPRANHHIVNKVGYWSHTITRNCGWGFIKITRKRVYYPSIWIIVLISLGNWRPWSWNSARCWEEMGNFVSRSIIRYSSSTKGMTPAFEHDLARWPVTFDLANPRPHFFRISVIALLWDEAKEATRTWRSSQQISCCAHRQLLRFQLVLMTTYDRLWLLLNSQPIITSQPTSMYSEPCSNLIIDIYAINWRSHNILSTNKL